MTFQDLLSKVGFAPKTLTEAREISADAKTSLEAVAALFAAAGLNLDAMLEAGPESLKAHLDSISEAGDEAVARAVELEAQLETAQQAEQVAISTVETITTALGSQNITFNAETFGADLSARINAQAQELLAASGLPAPVAHVSDPQDPAAADEAHLAKWESMPVGPDRLTYFREHKTAIQRALNARE